ncbi:Ubiquitin-conjugating enzyme family protein [Acanthocheilonema viteae]
MEDYAAGGKDQVPYMRLVSDRAHCCSLIEDSKNRLLKDYLELQKDPLPDIVAKPLDESLLLWGYAIRGAKDTPFDGGIYYGEMQFTKDFPYIPPHIVMYTPNGRFKPGDQICLSISAFHSPNWDPSWTVGSFLLCFANFMMFDEDRMGTGFIASSTEQKRVFAKQSMFYNKQNEHFMKAFGEKPFDPEDSNDKDQANATDESDDEEESELSSFSNSDDERFKKTLTF